MATGVNDYHLLPIFLISLVVLLSATEFGRWLGTGVSDQGADEVLTLQGAVLGLLALMIAFTFAMALSRFEGRRDAVLNGRMPLAQQPYGRAYFRNRTARKH